MSTVQVPCGEDRTITRVIDAWSGATDVPSWWEPLFEGSGNASIFLSPDWIRSWLEVYCREFEGYWIHWQRDGAIVGGCLVAVRTIWLKFIPLRTLYLNATGESRERTPTAEYNDILCLPGHESAISADFHQFTRRLRWHRMMISGYQDCGLLAEIVGKFAAGGIESRSSPAAFVDLAAISDQPYEQTLTGKVGSHIRRNRRLYEKAFGAVQTSEAASLDEAMNYFTGLADLHNARWQKRGHAGSFSSSAVVDFHRRLIERLWSKKQVSMIRVGDGERIFGFLYNFVYQGKVFVFQTGFTYEDDSNLSPGLLTHALAIEYYRRQGMREYDLLAGNALYKRSLAKSSRNLQWTIIYRDNPLVWLYLLARKVRDTLIDAAKADV